MSDWRSALKEWANACLVKLEKADTEPQWHELNGDAGFRRYYRLVLPSSTLLAVYAPPETENNQAFLQIDDFLYRCGVHVPKIVAHDIGRGFFIIEDLGERLYLDMLQEDNVNTLYGEALFALLRIQQSPKDETIFPPYDEHRLRQEMKLFPEWFVSKMLGLGLTAEEQALIEQTFSTLVLSAVDQPQVIVHRDFHSRNIVYGATGTPGIIDFQDAVIGPVTYDLVSLLRDCYIAWPDEQVSRWALAYGSMAVDAGVIPPVSEARFLRWFDLMGLQRHLKVLGIFARLSLRDSKHGYLNDLPLVVRYVGKVLAKHEDLAVFHHWFERRLMPAIKVQPWMNSAA